MALRISRRVRTLGRPGALGAGTKGSMWNHSASDKSVWYALLMLGTLPSHYLRTPFRTVSEGSFSETQLPVMIILGNRASGRDCLKSPRRPQIEALRAGKTGQKRNSLAIIGPQITVKTPSQLLFRQSRKGHSRKPQTRKAGVFNSPGLLTRLSTTCC